MFVRSAHWCPFCMKQLVDVYQARERFTALGLGVASVSVDDVAEIAKFAKAQDIGYTMLADPKGDINLALGVREEQYDLEAVLRDAANLDLFARVVRFLYATGVWDRRKPWIERVFGY